MSLKTTRIWNAKNHIQTKYNDCLQMSWKTLEVNGNLVEYISNSGYSSIVKACMIRWCNYKSLCHPTEASENVDLKYCFTRSSNIRKSNQNPNNFCRRIRAWLWQSSPEIIATDGWIVGNLKLFHQCCWSWLAAIRKSHDQDHVLHQRNKDGKWQMPTPLTHKKLRTPQRDNDTEIFTEELDSHESYIKLIFDDNVG